MPLKSDKKSLLILLFLFFEPFSVNEIKMKREVGLNDYV